MKCFCVLLLLAALAVPAMADTRIQAGPTPGMVVLWWDANSEPDLAGYKVYWGRTSGNYTNAPQPVVAVMTQPQYTTPVLQNGTWYFAVTAFNKTGGESGYSNEVSTVINIAPAPPTGLRFTIAKVISAVWHWLTGRG
jgi:fibronectin type 3 domain-containing protein